MLIGRSIALELQRETFNSVFLIIVLRLISVTIYCRVFPTSSLTIALELQQESVCYDWLCLIDLGILTMSLELQQETCFRDFQARSHSALYVSNASIERSSVGHGVPLGS